MAWISILTMTSSVIAMTRIIGCQDLGNK